MLALIGAVTVVVLLAVAMLNLVSPLIAVPAVASLLAGFGLGTSKVVIAGITSIAPVAGMFVFAILYFGVMTDAGMLDPIIARIPASTLIPVALASPSVQFVTSA